MIRLIQAAGFAIQFAALGLVCVFDDPRQLCACVLMGGAGFLIIVAAEPLAATLRRL